MKKRTLWLGLSFLLVAALVLTGCLPPPEEPVVEEPVVEEPVVEEYKWTFTPGEPIEWSMTHGFAPAEITEDGLTTRVYARDPYMHSPPVRINTEKHRRIIVGLKASGNATRLKFYWVSDVSPEWDESKALEVPIKADGKLHEYVFDLGIGKRRHPHWKGIVTMFRLDLEPVDSYGAELSIRHVKIPPISILGPEFEIKGPYLSTPIPTTSNEFRMSLGVYNTGGERLNLRFNLEIDPPVRVLSSQTVEVKLEVDEDQYISWTLESNKTGIYEAKIYEAKINETHLVKFPIFPEVDIESKINLDGEDGITLIEDGSFILKSRETLILFMKSQLGYGPIIVLLEDEGEWKPMGAFGAFASLNIIREGGLKEQVYIIPNNVSVNETSIDFTYPGNGEWEFSSTWGIVNQSVKVENRLKALKEINVTRFSATLYPGELGFASSQDEALFPGLEWLVRDEISSSTLDIAAPHNIRNAPNPFKVTIPLMAVRHHNSLIAALWDPYFSWDGVHSSLSPQFASPNWVEGQDNHLFMLFTPTVPEWVKENDVEAYKPYKLGLGRRLSIGFRVYAATSNTVLDAIREWIRIFGLPKLEFPRSLEEGLRLSMEAYLESLWVPERGWGHAAGWEPHPYPGYALLLYLTSLIEEDPEIKAKLIDRFNEAVQLALKTLKTEGPGYITSLAGTAGLHIPGWQLPFYIGYLEESLSSIRSQIHSLIDKQGVDGEWGFQPTERTRVLGASGVREVGITARRAAEVLRWARMTGDKFALRAGLRALEAMRRYFVPRGAQTWEIAVRTPDVLASAKAVEAHLEAYKATGNKDYLERARYWAYTGLPFIYLWSTPDIDLMRYASIAVYGATFYHAPIWIGKPVQWCGLVYAYQLLRLSNYDNSFPWRVIGEGILKSGMHQQVVSENLAGTFPDAWILATDTIWPPYINPEGIVKPILFLTGLDPDLNTVVLREPYSNITVTTPARILETHITSTHLRLDLSFFRDETIHVLIFNFLPKSIYKLGTPLNYVEDLDAVTEGWTLTPEGFILVKVEFHTEKVEISAFK